MYSYDYHYKIFKTDIILVILSQEKTRARLESSRLAYLTMAVSHFS